MKHNSILYAIVVLTHSNSNGKYFSLEFNWPNIDCIGVFDNIIIVFSNRWNSKYRCFMNIQ